MSSPGENKKTLRLKPEVEQFFNDLEEWLNYCRFNLINYNPADMYRSQVYKSFQREKEYLERKARREARAKDGNNG